MIVVFFINRLPTQVLNYTSHFQSLYHRKPNYKLLRVFGCACFPYLRPYNKHKFAFHTTKCVFPYYNLVHKGFCCLSSLGQIYTTMSVLFDEEWFPFAIGFQVKRCGMFPHQMIFLTFYYIYFTLNNSFIIIFG